MLRNAAKADSILILRMSEVRWRSSVRKSAAQHLLHLPASIIPASPFLPHELTRRATAVKVRFMPRLHVAPGGAANVLAYDRWVGQWSRLFVSTVISAAEVTPGAASARRTLFIGPVRSR